MATYLDLYNQIKSLESVFQVPADYVTIDVGTFDASNGSFSGLTTQTETDPEPIEHQPGQRPINPAPHFVGERWVSVTIDSHWRKTITTTPAPKVGLAPVLLQFQVVNQGNAGCRVTVGGQAADVALDENGSLRVNIWDLPVVDWTIRCGGQSFGDRIMIQRSQGAIVGAGAFTVPALPLAIIYAPPSDSLSRSKTTYSQSEIVGTTSSFQLTNDSSTVTPWLPQQLDDLNSLKSALNVISTVMGKINNPYAQAVATASGAIATGIGNINGTETSGQVDTIQHTITLTESRTESIYAEAVNGGPGSGDSIHYLRDAKFAWVVADGRLRISLLGGIKASYPAGYLQQHAAEPQITNLPQDVTETLLGLDPFTSGTPGAVLPSPRFEDVSAAVYGGPLEFGGGQTITGSYSKTFSTTDTRTTNNYTSYMQDYNPGWLGKLLGGQAQTLKTTTSFTSAAGTTQTDTQTYSWELHSGPNDRFIVEFWIDHVFGTLALRQQIPAGTPRLLGIARGWLADPLINQPVSLTVGGKTYYTVTDENGNYAFFSNDIPSGEATLQVGNEPARPVNVG